MAFRPIFLLPAALSALALSGCGGSTGTPAAMPVVGGNVALTDMASRDTSTLQAYGIDSTSGSTTSQRGTLDRSTATGATDTTGATVTLDSLSGTVSSTDANGTYVALSVGGQLKVLYGTGGENYVAFYTAQPASGDPTTGVIGVPSDATSSATTPLPATGSAIYSGEAKVEIIDGSSLYDLTGTSGSTVDFGTSKVSTQLSSLNGTKQVGTSAATNVSNVADVSIDGANLVNGAFSGGTATVSATSSSDSLTTSLTGSEVVTQSGSLYGPGGVEIGGEFIVDDTASGSLLLQGSFIGKQ